MDIYLCLVAQLELAIWTLEFAILQVFWTHLFLIRDTGGIYADKLCFNSRILIKICRFAGRIFHLS